MSRNHLPKQLIPFIGGRSLLQIAYDRLDGLIPPQHRYICAGTAHREAVFQSIPGLEAGQFLGEPCGRDTLNAAAYSAAVIGRQDTDAVISVFTADHVITPEEQFRDLVQCGMDWVEHQSSSLLTFGITPTEPATGYGYLQLGKSAGGMARLVTHFHEKPALDTARTYVQAGPREYLWNSGMFVWEASTLLASVRRYRPENYQGILRIQAAWGSPDQERILAETYSMLEKISVDYGVMEPASRDPDLTVAALPMEVDWLDVGAWPAFAQTCPVDENCNALGAKKTVLMDAHNTLVASSDPDHLIAAIGCEDLVIIHTADATLVCPRDHAQQIKDLHQQVADTYGDTYV
jgi:mannose-1-phosphate guanylyltransferase